MNDSIVNLKRGLRKTYKGILWKLGLWTLLAVAMEVVVVDLASLFFQVASLGSVSQRLALKPEWLGLPLGASVPALTLLKISLAVIMSLAIRLWLGQRRDRQTERIAGQVSKELRTRLFRESHRPSGMLITPESADGTVALVQEAALQYGRSLATQHRDLLETSARIVAGLAMAATVRWDWAIIITAGATLYWALDRQKVEAVAQAKEWLDAETLQTRRSFKEELREAYQGRSIGSEMGSGRPSDRWIARWAAFDQAANNALYSIYQAANWGRLAIASLLIFAIAFTAASKPVSPGGMIALLCLALAGFVILTHQSNRREEIDTGLNLIVPIHNALTSSVRIWDMTDSIVMQPCRTSVRIEGLPLGLSPEDPRSQMLLDADIPARKVTAIVCPDLNQRRKLMRLMARWEDPIAGRIMVDGTDIRACTIGSTRLQVGTLRSDAYVSTGTILQNITFNDPRGDLLSAIDAAKDVHAHRLIQRTTSGYQTVIDAEKQADESVYARFLIALARGRWHDPSILLVEEPSPGMTRGMRELLRDAYRRLSRERTVIIFTRHAASVLAADHVILIGPHRVIQGSPKTLMRSSGPFRRAMLQMGLGLKPKTSRKAVK